MQNKTFRTNGAAGSLLDEYEKSIQELKEVIHSLSEETLTTIVDHKTKDPDCKSIQTVLSHIVQSGYTYVVEVRKWLGEDVDYRDLELCEDIPSYYNALDEMFLYNIQLFEDYPKICLEEYSVHKIIKARWGQNYDVEQLFEHAIVHVLRHRRQIERFKLQLDL